VVFTLLLQPAGFFHAVFRVAACKFTTDVSRKRVAGVAVHPGSVESSFVLFCYTMMVGRWEVLVDGVSPASIVRVLVMRRIISPFAAVLVENLCIDHISIGKEKFPQKSW
jgi:hypothetical protein